jgi:hypothetical protein
LEADLVIPTEDVYFSADIEADGPIPGRFSMLSFGLCVAGTYDGRRFERIDPMRHTFYRELRPISDNIDEAALAVAGLDRDRLLAEGQDPQAAMNEAADWVRETAGDRQAVLAAMPVAFDWAWLYWYFNAFAEGGSPFGVSNCFDVKTAYAVKSGEPIAHSHRNEMPAELRSDRPHTHHALDDAAEQADIFANLMEWPGPGGPNNDR